MNASCQGTSRIPEPERGPGRAAPAGAGRPDPRPSGAPGAAASGSALGVGVGVMLAVMLALIAWLVLTRVWGAGSGAASRPPAIPAVIFLTIDTLRADSLPFHGNPRVRTPALAEIARSSILFEQAIAPSPWTHPSVASFLTGLSPAVHGITSDSLEVETLLPPSVRTLAEHMRDAGYATAAIGYNPGISTSPNLRRGFESFQFFPGPNEDAAVVRDEDGRERHVDVHNATEILTELAERWLDENAGRPFFLWLHYYDPHTPYTPPAGDFEALMGENATEGQTFLHWRTAVVTGMAQYLYLERTALAGGETESGRTEMQRLRAALHQRRKPLRGLYDAEVQDVDRAVGRVLERLKRLGLYEDALLLLTSDHGEEFFDHGGLDHGHTLYQELLHVPLLVKLPGAREGRRVPERVSNRSLFPTFLELCCGATAAPEVDIASLLPFFRETSVSPGRAPYLLADSIIFGEPATAIVFGDMKYIHAPGSGAEELYDLAADPGETASLISRAPAALEEGRRHYADAVRRAAANKRRVWSGGRTTRELPEETRKTLRSHGYLK